MAAAFSTAPRLCILISILCLILSGRAAAVGSNGLIFPREPATGNKYPEIMKVPTTFFVGEPFEITWDAEIIESDEPLSLDLLAEDYSTIVEHIAVNIKNTGKFVWTPAEDINTKSGYAIRMYEGIVSVSATPVFTVAWRKPKTTAIPSSSGKATSRPSPTAAAPPTRISAPVDSNAEEEPTDEEATVKEPAIAESIEKQRGPSAAAVGGAVGGVLGAVIIALLALAYIGLRRGWWFLASKKDAPPPGWAPAGWTENPSELGMHNRGSKWWLFEKRCMPQEMGSGARVELDSQQQQRGGDSDSENTPEQYYLQEYQES